MSLVSVAYWLCFIFLNAAKISLYRAQWCWLRVFVLSDLVQIRTQWALIQYWTFYSIWSINQSLSVSMQPCNSCIFVPLCSISIDHISLLQIYGWTISVVFNLVWQVLNWSSWSTFWQPKETCSKSFSLDYYYYYYHFVIDIMIITITIMIITITIMFPD